MCLDERCRHIQLIETEKGSKKITHYEYDADKNLIPFYQEFWFVGFQFPLVKLDFTKSEMIGMNEPYTNPYPYNS